MLSKLLFYFRSSGLTINKKDDTQKMTIGKEDREYVPTQESSNRRLQTKNCEIDLNVKKEVVRPASAKIELRTRTPGSIINSGSSQRTSNLAIQPSNRNYNPISNNLVSNSNRLKSSPSANSIISTNKNAVPATPQKMYEILLIKSESKVSSNYGVNVKPTIRASSARPMSKIPQVSNRALNSNIMPQQPLRNEKSASPGRVLSANHNNMNININVNNINIVNNVNNRVPSSYEYKSPYKNNPVSIGQISRVSSSKERNDRYNQPYLVNPGLALNQKQPTKVVGSNYSKISNDHKILLQPVKVLESGPKRISSAHPSVQSNYNQNNFLRGVKPVSSEGSGMMKIIHNNQPKLVNLYRK